MWASTRQASACRTSIVIGAGEGLQLGERFRFSLDLLAASAELRWDVPVDFPAMEDEPPLIDWQAHHNIG